MGLKGKLIASMEVTCGGDSVHDIFHNTHQIRNISPRVVSHFEIHESEIGKVGTIQSGKYNEDGKEKFVKVVIEAIDPQTKSITWKVTEGDMLELYNTVTLIASFEHQWATLALIYEKKTEDVSEPLVLLGCFLDVTKDIERHLLMK